VVVHFDGRVWNNNYDLDYFRFEPVHPKGYVGKGKMIHDT